MNSPGCGGVMPILVGVSIIRVVLQVQVADFSMFKIEGQPPITADGNRPCPGTVAFKLVNAPTGRANNAAHVGSCDQHGQDVTQPPHEVGPELPAIVVLNEPQKPSVLD